MKTQWIAKKAIQKKNSFVYSTPRSPYPP